MKIKKPELKNPRYQPNKIEEKWQQIWNQSGIYSPNLDTAKKPFGKAWGKPFYNLMMFPYPSAEGMHVGNMYAFTGADVYGRFMRMKGFDVFEPIGLDGFGIHSENYAIKVGRHPKEQAKISEKNFYRQLRATGNGFDWSRRLETYDPKYYKWTQWLFIQLFKAGLAYRAKAKVNWCPSCKTVLADEQVIDGKCERCGSMVEKRELEQWFFKITDYAKRLLNNIPKLDWSEKVKIAQGEWIGKSEGLIFTASVKGSKLKIQTFSAHFEAFRADTFVVIAPDHSLLEELIHDVPNKKEILDFCRKIVQKRQNEPHVEEKNLEGIFTGKYIVDPVGNGDLPIWVANYAIKEYGTGIVKCSVHDQRDFAFAKKYGIRLKPVLFPKDPEQRRRVEKLEECYTDMTNGYLTEPSEFAGKPAYDVRKEIVKYVLKHGLAEPKTQYHLRDWLISRQRYWGPPIPMVYCEKCGWQPVPEKDLPVLLPDVKDWKPTGTGKSPLANVESFVNTNCPNCKSLAKRETDVSDTFLDSSWYFFRYTSTDIDSSAFDIKRVKKWLPVKMYIGGAEHSVLHLLYSRFIAMALYDLGLISFEEPFSRFYAHGLLIKEGAKMSKSKGNVVTPDEYIKKYGADTLRCYLMFLGPFDEGGDFYDTALEGMYRFLKRVWNLVLSIKYHVSSINSQSTRLDRVMNKTIKLVTDDLERLHYNTAIARIMEYYNTLHRFYTKYKILNTKYCKTLVLLLAPFAPHVTEELYQRFKIYDLRFKNKKEKNHKSYVINHKSSQSIHNQPWPTYDPKFFEEDEVTIVVQVNGKLRNTIEVQSSKFKVQSYIEELARRSEKVRKYLEGMEIKKVVYVEGKVINFVTE